MTFEYKPERYEDGSGSDHWFAGIYKITKYDEITTGRYRRTAFYHAYFKPVGWKNWGNHVDRRVKGDEGYDSLEEAQRACVRHAAQFRTPYENDSL